MQPQMAALLMLGDGTSYINETIFENRFKYVAELRKMGANIKVEGSNVAIIEGIEKATAAILNTPDLRAGAALTIAALATEGRTVIRDIEYIERGYENFDEKLRALGASIEKQTAAPGRRKTKFA
jgi:UDP-N-acetylglucosamine 1-carboxyvinyltransferase